MWEGKSSKRSINNNETADPQTAAASSRLGITAIVVSRDAICALVIIPGKAHPLGQPVLTHAHRSCNVQLSSCGSVTSMSKPLYA